MTIENITVTKPKKWAARTYLKMTDLDNMYTAKVRFSSKHDFSKEDLKEIAQKMQKVLNIYYGKNKE